MKKSTFFGFVIWLLAGFVVAEEANHSTIHLIVAADGRAGFESNMVDDYRNINRVFRENVPADRLRIVALKTDEITPDGILDAVAGIEIHGDDTLILYYSGHAADGTNNGGHFFQLKDVDGNPTELRRRTLLARMKEKNARLTVLLTDCCNCEAQSSELAKSFSKSTATPARPSSLFEALFFKPTGVVDITSSKRASCFSWPLVHLLENNREDGTITWEHFVSSLKLDVRQAFLENRPESGKFGSTLDGVLFQKTQTIQVNGPLPGESTVVPETHGPRFGVRAVGHPKGGVRITQVVPRGPGHRAGFEIGDVIIEINGKPVLDERAYSDLIDASPKQCRIKMINGNDGKTILVDFELGN